MFLGPDINTTPVNAELFEVVFEQNVMGMALRALDLRNSRWLRVNQKFCDMLGYTREELLQLTFVEISYPGEQHHAVHYNEQLLRGEVRSYSREKRFIRKDGSTLWTNVWLSVVPDDQGNAGQVIVVIQDISEQKKATDTLTDREAQLRAILDHSTACINLKDVDGRYLYANKEYEKWWGFNIDDVIGKTFGDLGLSQHQMQLISEHEREVLESGIAQQREVQVTRRVDGKTHDRISIKFPVKSPEGTVIGLGTFSVDITEKKKAELELRRHRDHLQEMVDTATLNLKTKAQELQVALAKEKELNELQQQFVSMASHEFRTPLTIIDTAAQRIKRQLEKNKLEPATALQKIENIRCAVRRMTRLMESTLTAARLGEGKIAIEIDPCSVATILHDVCTRHDELAPAHEITCDTSRLPARIQADSGSIEQIFSNLLSNAIKYSPTDPRIEVAGWQEDGYAVITVRDYGIGIDAEDINRIGEKFFRAKTSTGISGTGIGLNLTKTLVEMHGGTLDVSSVEGQGSIFITRLPIAGPNHTAQEHDDAAEVA